MADTARIRPAGTGPAQPRPARPLQALALLTLVASAAVAGIGLVWLLAPTPTPFADGQLQSAVSAWLGPTAVSVIAVAIGVLGLLITVAVLHRGALPTNPWGIAIGAAAIAVVLGCTFGSISVIAYAGYLFGIAAVLAGVITMAVMIVRAPRIGLALLAGLAIVVAVAVGLAGLTFDGVATFATAFAAALLESLPTLLVIIAAVVATAAWAALAIIAFRAAPAGQRFEHRLIRHRRALAILAALGPLPYAIARASWLTPWPLFAPEVEHLPPEVIATGLMLGAGAVAASILTLGLTLPWGRILPRWMPVIGGRRVPISAAAVPGFTAAGLICIAAGPTLVTTLANADAPVSGLIVAIVLPLWYWGPMLALAVWAYTAWRVGNEQRTPEASRA